MVEIEKHNCNDGNEARAREEYWKCHFNAQLNTKRAYITDVEKIDYKKQFYLDNKDNILKHQKTYKDNNKQKIIEQRKQYYYNKKNNITDSSSDDLTECITH